YLAARKPAETPAAAPAGETPAAAAPSSETPAAPADAAASEPAANAAANAEPAAASEPAAELAPAAEPDPELIVELPPRNVGGESLKIVAGDKATADRLRMMQKGYVRGEELRTRLEAVEQRELTVRETEVLATTDPLGLIERADANV